jgi:hypothetical protein
VLQSCDVAGAARGTLIASVERIAMADKFDPYREALVVETETRWPAEYDDWDPDERARIERLLHERPQEAAQLEYLRMHTGFCRRITVTPEDVQRVM